MKLIKQIVASYQDFSKIAQQSLGSKGIIEKKNNFNISSYLQQFHSFDTYCYFIADTSRLKIIEVGGAVEQLSGYEPSYFEGKSYQIMLKLYKIADVIKMTRGGSYYFNYLYQQLPEHRPFIKANVTVEMKRKNGSWLPVLFQSIPILFNDKMEVIYFLNILTDIESLNPSQKYAHYIIDSSDSQNIKKIPVHQKDFMQLPQTIISEAEKRVLALMANGMSSKQIAHELSLSEYTIKNHRKSMLQKTESSSSAALVKRALVEGWI
jgi:DNA-binding CsgD family transcriptional regulator